MLFNSFQFLLFFPLVTAMYFAVTPRLRWTWLLIASCYFYMVFVPRYILILFALILIDFSAGLIIEKARRPYRAITLGVSLCANLGMLATFKYFNFVMGGITSIGGVFGWEGYPFYWNVLLPIGLSFHTFQSISYTIEVYRGNVKAERHLGIYAVYVLFYPQMVAGPIERPQHLLPQLRGEATVDWTRIGGGLRLMLWGLFKKMVIADNLAPVVSNAYGNPTAYAGWPLILATYAFSIQILCDFSGYTDIARGAAQVMGIDLMKNFETPYFAGSVKEFWGRWHISLSSWFRDYLYFPLGGNRLGKSRTAVNILVVFLVSGLWHGADSVFILWGGLHGFYLVTGNYCEPMKKWFADVSGLMRRPKLHRLLQCLITFHLVTFAWIFFRAGSADQASQILKCLFGQSTSHAPLLPLANSFQILALLTAVAVLAATQTIKRNCNGEVLLGRIPACLRWNLYAVLVVWIMLCGQFKGQDFIYFQF